MFISLKGKSDRIFSGTQNSIYRFSNGEWRIISAAQIDFSNSAFNCSFIL